MRRAVRSVLALSFVVASPLGLAACGSQAPLRPSPRPSPRPAPPPLAPSFADARPSPSPSPPRPLAAPPSPAPPPRPPSAAGTPPPAAGATDLDPLFRPFTGVAPPELGASGTWVFGGPTSLAALRGRVVYLQFSFAGCAGCVPTMPMLRRFHDAYASRGLTVLYVANAGMETLERSRDEVARGALPYAYFHDTRGETVAAYAVRAFPTAYLLDRAGHVFWSGPPQAIEEPLARAIEGALDAR